jgi:hypothetical protein
LDAQPILQISEVTTHIDGELTVFLLAGGELLAKPLPAGSSWLLQLGKLPEGRYIIEVTHRRIRFEPVRMPFTVISTDGSAPSNARLSVEVDAAAIPIQPEGVVSYEGDFTTLGAGGATIQIQGPPLWPCHRSWIGETQRYYGTTSLSESGEIDLEELDSCTIECRQRNRIGNLVLDFEELGLVELRHTRRIDPEQLRVDIVRLTQEKAHAVEAMSGQFPLLRNMWIHPFLERLGYRFRELDPSILEQAPPEATAILLYEYKRSNAQVVIGLKAPLLLTATSADWNSFSDTSVHAFAEQLCRHFNLGEAFITDGLRWTRHRKGKRIHSQVWDLRDIALESDSAKFESFLFDFAPEV